MKPLYATLAGLAGVLLAVPTAAAPCQPGQCATPAVVTSAPVVAPVAAITTALPLYGAGYTGAGYGSDDETKELLRQLLAEVKAMRQDLAAAKGPDAPPGGDAVGTLSLTAPSVQTVLQKNCASCHTGDKSKGGFQLYVDAGQPVKLSPADRREVERRVKAGQMPPPPAKFPPADKDLVLKAIASGK